MNRRQAYRAFEDHLEEVIGVSEAEVVVDDLDRRVTQEILDAALDRQSQRLAALWRRDLLLMITGQFVALAGVLTAVS